MRLRNLIFLVMFCPLPGIAQLGRLRTNMTEPEFVKAFPEAHRDYESEAYWVTDRDTIEGATGNSLWRVLNDTITEYSFRSLKVNGPSYRYTTVDSSRVHQLRVSAMQLEATLEKKLGAPTELRGKDLLSRPREPEGSHSPGMETAEENELYFAQWIFDDGRIIILKVSSDLSPGNRINAPVAMQTQKSESYEFYLTVTRSLPAAGWNFEVGSTTHQFESRHPGLLGDTLIEHFYAFTDSMRAPYGEWDFHFVEGKLSQVSYRVYNGTAYGDRIDSLSYSTDKFRAEKLMEEGNASFGKADCTSNTITPEYVNPDSHLQYRRTYLSVTWTTLSGPVNLIFEESGGGKSHGVTFSIQVDFHSVK